MTDRFGTGIAAQRRKPRLIKQDIHFFQLRGSCNSLQFFHSFMNQDVKTVACLLRNIVFVYDFIGMHRNENNNFMTDNWGFWWRTTTESLSRGTAVEEAID